MNNPFLVNVSILHFLKTSENQVIDFMIFSSKEKKGKVRPNWVNYVKSINTVFAELIFYNYKSLLFLAAQLWY